LCVAGVAAVAVGIPLRLRMRTAGTSGTSLAIWGLWIGHMTLMFCHS